jgi:hypothetical protein
MKNLEEENWWRRIYICDSRANCVGFETLMCIMHTLKSTREKQALIDIFLNAMEEETKPIAFKVFTPNCT